MQTIQGANADGDITLTGVPITKDDKDAFTTVADNASWYDHTGLAMYNRANISGTLISSQDTPGLPILDTVFDVLLGVINVVFSAVGDLLGALGSSVGFDAINSDGYATSTVSVPVTSIPVYRSLGQAINAPANVPVTPLIFSSNAGVLTDGWNAGGAEHTYNQAAGTVPTSLLKALFDLPGLSVVWDAIGILAPELRRCGAPSFLENPFDLEEPHWADDKGSLWFGHIDSEAVHRDRLDVGPDYREQLAEPLEARAGAAVEDTADTTPEEPADLPDPASPEMRDDGADDDDEPPPAEPETEEER